ncbi:hypothetical protein K239x_16070 [Planctomycetes bacterium K23_9]|uniref:Uncharacterized protein n=1 Tax=Stieleria marina TaxID=1930275 RepID=A0A517NRB1_9BACT|nr:hypothetical protein K239x_16070 [Planctomycetes bacterium K23_9]
MGAIVYEDTLRRFQCWPSLLAGRKKVRGLFLTFLKVALALDACFGWQHCVSAAEAGCSFPATIVDHGFLSWPDRVVTHLDGMHSSLLLFGRRITQQGT